MNYVFFDLETQNLFDDVGGRDNIEKLKLACAVTFSTAKNDFSVYWEQDVSALLAELRSATKVIGLTCFNLITRYFNPMRRRYALPRSRPWI